MQVGRDLRKSLVQSSPQARLSCEMTPGYLGLCPINSQKPTRMDMARSLWATCSLPDCPHREEVFSRSLRNTSSSMKPVSEGICVDLLHDSWGFLHLFTH